MCAAEFFVGMAHAALHAFSAAVDAAATSALLPGELTQPTQVAKPGWEGELTPDGRAYLYLLN